MITLGLDIGSNTLKAVAMQDGQRVLASHVERSSHDLEALTERCVQETLGSLGLTQHDCHQIVATGYGRVSCSFATRNISEVTCHARGASFFLPKIRTVIDIGGQDSKVIIVSEKGKMVDFAMNDKCAAGTGRFLEVMAQALGVPLAEFAALGDRATAPVSISNTCAVFAESEVVGLVARRLPKEDIVAGLHLSIAAKVTAMSKRVRVADPVAFTGGVALNGGVKKALEAKLGRPLLIPPNPQLIGAVGAALLGFE